ncbi:uncharacterized protein LOC117634960 [Prunus dulcis]|nr:uncharacterized protein LOC117634960 [Prunus dulcis]
MDKLVECENNAKNITVWVSKSADQITESATDVKETLCLTRKMDAAFERMERYGVGVAQGDRVARLTEWVALGKAVQALSEDVNEMVLKPSQFKLFFEVLKRNIDQLSEHWKEPNVNEVEGAIPFLELQKFRKKNRGGYRGRCRVLKC